MIPLTNTMAAVKYATKRAALAVASPRLTSIRETTPTPKNSNMDSTQIWTTNHLQ
jgi:hypothetical protein